MINGEMLQASIRVSEDPSELGVQDYVIIAVKVPSLPDIARRIDPLFGPETAVVTAMNGVPWWFLLNARGVLAGHKLRAIDPDGAIGQAIATRRVVTSLRAVFQCKSPKRTFPPKSIFALLP